MRYGTSIISGVIFCFTCGVALFTVSFARNLSGPQAASFEFAYLYLGLLAVCSLGATISGLAEARMPQAKTARPGKTFYAFVLLCVLYLLALTVIGRYLPVTIISLAAAMLLLGVRPLTALGVSAGFSALMYGVFSMFLNVPLP